MFPERMLKVEIIVMKSRVEEVVAGLHKVGLLHIESTKMHDEWIKNAPPIQKIEKLSHEAKLVREILAIAKSINIEESGRKDYKEEDLERIVGLQNEINELQKRMEALEKRAELLNILKSLDINTLPVEGKVYYELFEVIPEKVEAVVAACRKIDVDFEYRKEKQRAHIFICGGAADREKIKNIAKELSLLPIKIENVKNVNEQLRENEEERRRIIDKIEALNNRMREEISPILWNIRRNYMSLQVEIDRAEIVSKFGQSERLYFITGWIRERDRKRVEDLITSYGKYAMVTFSEPHHDELPPTALKTPKNLQSFESLLRFIATPRSDEIDPTMLIAITLPIMYGMIIGDIGYALVLMALSYYLARKTGGMLRDLMEITFIASFWGIMWGAIFGEFFGFELEFEIFGLHFPLINRLHGVINLFLLTIGLGAVHIALGNALGAVEGLKHGNMRHTIAKLCWVLLEVGLLLLLFSPQIGIVLSMLSFIGIITAEGVVAIIEIPGMIANIMSYLRIAAVGLSGVILAFLINMMRPDPAQGPLMVVTLVVFAAAHFIAICIAAFESIVQGGRLHAVEFFSKFFRGGGIMFNPFRMEENVEVK